MRLCNCASLSQGATSGVVDQASNLIATRGLFFFDRTKAIVCSYLAGLIKGVIPPYYSYYREDPTKVTVQEVVGFLYKAIKDPDWMKIQATMDTFESLAMSREVPQYLLWTNLATSDELNAVKSELVEYFQLDQAKSTTRDVAQLLGIDLSKVKTYLIYGGVAFVGLMFLPQIVGGVRALAPRPNRHH